MTFAKLSSAILLPLLTVGQLSLLASCAPETKTSDKIEVVVTVLPQAEFVENVGGEMVNVAVMVPAGASPHTYGPTPSQMAAVAGAEIYARVGSGIDFELVSMEKLIAVGKDMLVVDCTEGIELQPMGDDEHERSSLDPHVWMSPSNAGIMVRNICEGLIRVDPEKRTYYEQNRDTYLEQLTQLGLYLINLIRDGIMCTMTPNNMFFALRHYTGEKVLA